MTDVRALYRRLILKRLAKLGRQWEADPEESRLAAVFRKRFEEDRNNV